MKAKAPKKLVYCIYYFRNTKGTSLKKRRNSAYNLRSSWDHLDLTLVGAPSPLFLSCLSQARSSAGRRWIVFVRRHRFESPVFSLSVTQLLADLISSSDITCSRNCCATKNSFVMLTLSNNWILKINQRGTFLT